jgi:murein DD-endopeptidase MepM/ murein hydrolase activator NlpD
MAQGRFDPFARLDALLEARRGSASLPDAQSGTSAPGIPAQGAPAHGGYPLAKVGKVIGVPYQGTHTMYGNWESDNAVDIAAPIGTPVYATQAGVIGSQIGPLNSSDPHLLGQRLHLVTHGNEWYYAHLSKIVVKPGERVQPGQLLGYSGSANGVAHLHIASKAGSPLALTRGSS